MSFPPLADTRKYLANANKELDAIEKQREKMPIKLYKIHRKIYLEFVGDVKARTVDEAKQVPVINPKTGEPFRKQKKKDDKDKKVQSKKITKSKVNKGKKKNAKKK